MFTGIIQEIGIVKRVEQKGAARLLVIKCHDMQKELEKGASIACDGICLTVVAFDEHSIKVEVMRETTSRTTLNSWQPSYKVNLERAAKTNSRLDGHLMQGHIDCTASVLQISRREESLILEIGYPAEYAALLVEKGSVAVNGVSLTVVSLSARSFTVSLVGFTISHTNLSILRPGDRVNLEFDIIGKYINRYIKTKTDKITEDKLREEGF